MLRPIEKQAARALPRDLLRLTVFASAFLLAYGNPLSLSAHAGSPFYLPDAVLLSALLLSPRRTWWPYLLIPLPIRLLVTDSPSLPLWFLLLAYVNDALKALTAAILTKLVIRLRPIRFEVLQDLWAFWLVAVLCVPALSALVGAAAWVRLGREFWPICRQWFLGDALANLVVTPLILYTVQSWRTLDAVRRWRFAEALVLFLALPLAAWFAFQAGVGNGEFIQFFGYIPVPFLIWAAARFGLWGASGALTMMSIVAVFAVSARQSGLSEHQWVESTLSVQMLIGVLAVPILSLAVLVEHQRRTAAFLRESDQRFRNMADSAPVMIWVTGPDGRATFFNKVWLDFIGRSLNDALAYGWKADLHPDHRDTYAADCTQALERRHYFRTEYRLRRADGEYRWILSSAVPRFAPAGEFAGYIASCVDITDFKRAQEEALARQKLESLGVVANGIAHDFNNLLGSIMALAENAATEAAEAGTSLQDLQTIQDVANRGSEIVRELMIYSGQDRPSLELLNLSHVVADTMALIKVSISRHAFLHTDLPHDLPAVRCGGARIRQVVMNLVINASEALGGREGIIGLRTARVSAAAAGLDEGEYVRLEVSDTGCGMTPSDQARIFDPFYSTKFAGRGMGLAVVQGIVRDHDGVIRVSSTPGRGTTFEVYLPCAAKAVESPAPDSGAAQPLEAPMAAGILLFVEDEEMLRQPVAGMLRKNGFTVLEAGDGAVAVDVLESRDIDAMILDVTLPGVSSREVFETARGRHPKLKIVLTSAYSREAVARTFAGHEVEFFIRKPFRFVDLMELLRTALPPAQSFATQGYHRIDARGAARGKVAGGEGDGAEQ